MRARRRRRRHRPDETEISVPTVERLREHHGQTVYLLDDEDGVSTGTLVVFPELLKPRWRPDDAA